MGDLTGGHPRSTPQVHLRDTATVALEGQDTQRLKKTTTFQQTHTHTHCTSEYKVGQHLLFSWFLYLSMV